MIWPTRRYFEICRGCYGLPQVGILANNLLWSCFVAKGYYKTPTTPGLWRHKWQPNHFCLLVPKYLGFSMDVNPHEGVSFICEGEWHRPIVILVILLQIGVIGILDYKCCWINTNVISKSLKDLKTSTPTLARWETHFSVTRLNDGPQQAQVKIESQRLTRWGRWVWEECIMISHGWWKD